MKKPNKLNLQTAVLKPQKLILWKQIVLHLMVEEVNVLLSPPNFQIKTRFQKSCANYSQHLNQMLDHQFMEVEVIHTVNVKVLITSTCDNQIPPLIRFIEDQTQASNPYLNSVNEAQIFQICLTKKIKQGILMSFIQDPLPI